MSVVCEVGVYEPSSAKTSGWTRVLEQEKTPYRKINDPGCPVIVCEGQVPDRLSELLLSLGDTLRTFSRHSSITERIVAIDKAQILRVLVWILRKGFSLLGLPYIHLCYYPNRAASVFAFRIDVDGTYEESLTSI